MFIVDSGRKVATCYKTLEVNPHRGFIVGGFSGGASFAAIISQLSREGKLHPSITGQLLSCPSVVHRSVIPEQYKGEILSLDPNANTPVINFKSMELFEGRYSILP